MQRKKSLFKITTSLISVIFSLIDLPFWRFIFDSTSQHRALMLAYGPDYFLDLVESSDSHKSADKNKRMTLLMVFHSIQIFYIIPREDRKQLTHSQAIYVHISGLTCLSRFCCLLFPTGQGRSSVVSGSEVCRNDGGGLRSDYGERCHLEGCPHLVCSGKGPEHLE